MWKLAPQNCFLGKNLKIDEVEIIMLRKKKGRNTLLKGDQDETAYRSWPPWDKLGDGETSPSKPPQSAPRQRHNRLHVQCLSEWYTLGITHFCGIDEAMLKAACSSGWSSSPGSRVTFNRDQREQRFEDEKLLTHWRELRTILASSPWKLKSVLHERLLEKTRSKIVCSRAAASSAGSIWDASALRSSITFRIANKAFELRASKLISSFPALWGHSTSSDFQLSRFEGIEVARVWVWIKLSSVMPGEVGWLFTSSSSEFIITSSATCSPGVHVAGISSTGDGLWNVHKTWMAKFVKNSLPRWATYFERKWGRYKFFHLKLYSQWRWRSVTDDLDAKPIYILDCNLIRVFACKLWIYIQCTAWA